MERIVWVVLVSWNSRDDVIRCLEYLRFQQYSLLHVVVVDNGSLDNTASIIRSRFPHVSLFALPRNEGFARAANLGMQHALDQNADYVLLLNPDTRFDDDIVNRLVQYAEANPSLGIVTPKVMLERAPHRLWGVGGIVLDKGLQFFGLDEDDTGQYNTCRLDFVLGCAMLIRSDLLRRAGLLDEHFFVFFEEIDLCLRAQLAGWRVGIAPEINLLHAGGATTARRPAIRQFYLARSRMIFFRKHHRRFKLWKLLRQELVYTRKVVVGCVRQRDPWSALAYLRGCLAGYVGRGNALRADA